MINIRTNSISVDRFRLSNAESKSVGNSNSVVHTGKLAKAWQKGNCASWKLAYLVDVEWMQNRM